MKNLIISVKEVDSGKRIDSFLAEELSDFSRSYLKKIIDDGGILCKGKPVKASYKVCEGDEITAVIPDDKIPDIVAEDIPLDILYEDDDILIVNKPKDMVVHPATGHYTGTLVNGIMYHCADSLSGINGVLRPGIVHRIDKNTTGSLIVCKNDEAHRKLAEQLAVHSIDRKYRAIVHGKLKEDEFTIDKPIARSKTDRKKMGIDPAGRRAVTHVKVLEQFKEFAYVECTLETGRTHQIRVHMASIGHPVLGDDVYGPKKCPVKGLVGQTLHAYYIGFIHPGTNEYFSITAPLPEYFNKLLNLYK